MYEFNSMENKKNRECEQTVANIFEWPNKILLLAYRVNIIDFLSILIII